MKNRLNIITITILSLLLTITLLPLSIHAEETSLKPKEPDVSVFATKEQMMDGTFAPKTDGTAANYGKLVFGKRQSSDNGVLSYVPLEWYILGKDDGVSGDNTVIFASSSIAAGQKFNSNLDEKTYSYEAGTGYGETEGSITVYPSHYGASDLRDKLKNIATDTSHFITAEQNLLNATTITTKDTLNSTYYTTTDKLYALEAEELNISNKIIRAGSDNSKSLSVSSYWPYDEERFWLRTAADSDDCWEAETGYYYQDEPVGHYFLLRPASNLNLTDVLFASAAKYGEDGELANDAPMTLRFDGSNRNIGNISYDNNNIYVAPSGEVTLFVQGRNGDQNWVYSVNLAGTSVRVTKEIMINDINSNLSYLSASDIDLSKCKIWIEDKIDGLTYAVEAKKAINSVDITIDTPIANNPLATNATCNTTGVDTTKTKVTWDPASETVDYFKTYEASVTLTPETGYVFVNLNTAGGLIKASATVNGKTAKSVTGNTDGTLTVTYDFVVKDKIEDIEQPTLTYENGTIIDESKFPDQVKVTGSSDKEYELAVGPWAADLTNNYDPKRKDEQTLIYWTSLKEIPAELDYRNPDGPDVKLTITVKAAKIDSNTNGNHTVIIPDTGVK